MRRAELGSSSGYLAVCYHYIRPNRSDDPFPKILGNSVDEFHRHMKMLSRRYKPMSLEDANMFSYGSFGFPQGEYGVLLTFDDGLSDHFQAAQILAEYGIPAVFFIPTCILTDELPANPTIVHYCIAHYRIQGFLKAYRDALEESRIDVEKLDIQFHKGTDDPWKTIDTIKSTFRYHLEYRQARKILLHIYRNLLLRDFPDALSKMHLTETQIHEIVGMGHALGTHSHTHISVAATQLTESDFHKEIIDPKRILEQQFNEKISALSYPFGGAKDCLTSEALIRQTNEYRCAFTVNKIVNKKETPPFELGRYMPMSTDTAEGLEGILDSIVANS